MNYYFEKVTDPSVEPVTVSEVKSWARVSHSLEDTLIEGWIVAAREEAQRVQRRAFITQQFRIVFDDFPVLPFRFPYPPMQQIDSIVYVDSEGTNTTLYDLASPVGTEDQFIVGITSGWGRLAHAEGYTWPGVTLHGIDAVTITFTAGYGDEADDVPQTVKDAIMLYASYRYNNRCPAEQFPKQFYDMLYTDRVFKGAGE